MSKNKHFGSSFDDFLKTEGLLGEAEAIALKRVLAYKIKEEIEKQHLSKTGMADMMDTSRASLDRLLDPYNTSVTLNTMVKAAAVLHKKIHISFL